MLSNPTPTTHSQPSALVICPNAGDLVLQGAGLMCLNCLRAYEIVDGIPLLAETGSSELWGIVSEGQNSTAYQEHFLNSGAERVTGTRMSDGGASAAPRRGKSAALRPCWRPSRGAADFSTFHAGAVG